MLGYESAGKPTWYQARPENHPRGEWRNRAPLGGADFCYNWQQYEHHEKGPDFWFYSSMEINRTNAIGIYAFHTGANVVMCDASVHFKAEGTNPEIMVALYSRDGGSEEMLRLSELVE
jgi:hypothetical protein